MNATPEEIETDYWTHYYFEHPKEAEVVSDDPDFDLEEITRKAESGDWEDL